MTRECHVRFCESAGVQSPRATHLLGRKWRHALAHAIEHDAPVPIAMRQGEAERIGRPAARIAKRRVAEARKRRSLKHANINARLNRLAADKALNVGPEQTKPFSARRNRIARHRPIDDSLRKRRIEITRRALRNEDELVALLAKMALPCRVGLAPPRIGVEIAMADRRSSPSSAATPKSISLSGFTEPPSSVYQKAISSATTATAVTPRSLESRHGRISMSTPFVSESVSASFVLTSWRAAASLR